MKTIIISALVLFVQLSFAQVKRETGDFKSVKVFDRISVELIPADANVIEISGARSSEVEIVNKNGELRIRMPLPKLLKGDEINAKLYFKKIESIDASEGAFVSGSGVFTQTVMNVTAKEGAEVKVILDVDKANVKSVTGGIVTLSGSAKTQEVSIGTGGIVKAKKLATVQTNITVTTGGQADINASELVEAKIKAGGDITVYGNPKQIDEKITFGGTVTRAAE